MSHRHLISPPSPLARKALALSVIGGGLALGALAGCSEAESQPKDSGGAGASGHTDTTAIVGDDGTSDDEGRGERNCDWEPRMDTETIPGDFYVAPPPAGNDSHDGSSQAPWATLSKAASEAGPGQTVVIRDGVYRETRITGWRGGEPGNPVTFRAEADAKPIITTFQPLSDWTEAGDGLWRAAMNWTLSEADADGYVSPHAKYWDGTDQLLLDGEMLTEARWPDLPDGREPWQQRREDWAEVVSASVGNIVERPDGLYDTTVTYGFAKGSLPHVSKWPEVYGTVLPGGLWIAVRAEVLSGTQDQLTMKLVSGKLTGSLEPKAGDRVLLWGHKDLLNEPGEWARDAETAEDSFACRAVRLPKIT